MDIGVVVIIAVAVLAVAIVLFAVTFFAGRSKKSEHLRSRFGPEYDRALDEHEDRRQAEKDLEEREKRVRRLQLRPLSNDERQRFSDRWRQTQARFVDDPSGAIGDADRLVAEVMEARGYPAGEMDRRWQDLSVDHPQFVENYRAAHATYQANERDEADTESLRQAVIHYRALFDELLATSVASPSRR